MVKSLLLWILSLLLLAGSACSPVSTSDFAWRDVTVDRVWPPPPDQARIRYLRSFTGPDDFKSEGAKSRAWRWIFGEEQDTLPLLTPFSIATDPSGAIWVADNGARLLYVFDVASKKVRYIQEVGSVRLNTPVGVAIDGQRDRIYLADAAYNFILVLNSDGEFIDRWSPPGGFKRPAGMAVANDGRLFVADVMDGSVVEFDPNGLFVRKILSKVNETGRFNRPLNVAFGPGGETIILDAMSFRLEVLDPQGELIRTIGQLGTAPGSLARPKGLAVDSVGHIFVSDAAFDNIQIFDMAGNLLMYMGGPGAGPGQFNLPAGLFVDKEGRVYVADSYNHRVQVFTLLQ